MTLGKRIYGVLISGQYQGRKGFYYENQAKANKVFGTVTFYTKEGIHPYRTVVALNSVRTISKEAYDEN